MFQLSLDGESRFPLLAAEQAINLLEGDAAYLRLWRGLKAASLDPADSFSIPINREVYPGLRPFEPADAAAFFGRRHEIEQLVDLLHPTLQREAGRVVAIVGPSGSGKSSLLNAGLLPRLNRRDSPWIIVRRCGPASILWPPSLAASRGPISSSGQPGLGRHRDDHQQWKRRPARGRGRPGGSTKDRSRVLLVIDQAEELPTRPEPRNAEPSLVWCATAFKRRATVGGRWCVGLQHHAGAFRSCRGLRRLPGRRAAQSDRLPEVIEGPAALADLRFAPGLVQWMVQDTDTGTACFPAYTLRALCKVGPGGTVRIDDYEAVGGVVGALQRRADQFWQV